VSGHATPAWEAKIRARRCYCLRPVPASSECGCCCAEHDPPTTVVRLCDCPVFDNPHPDSACTTELWLRLDTITTAPTRKDTP
jgi:hypothetical protein